MKEYDWVWEAFRGLEPTFFFTDHGYSRIKVRVSYLFPQGFYALSVDCGGGQWAMVLDTDNYSLNTDPDKLEIIEAALMECEMFLGIDRTWGI